MLDMFNTAAAGTLSAIGAWAVMSPRVRCGLVALLGLALISFGFFVIFLLGLQPYTYQSAVAAAQAFVHVGLVLVVVGYLQRSRKRGHQRRASDWVERTTDPAIDSRPPSDLQCPNTQWRADDADRVR